MNQVLGEAVKGSVVSDEVIEWAYRLFLDRESDDPEVAKKMLGYESVKDLRKGFLSSEEFKLKNE